MKLSIKKIILTTTISGLGMWVVAGLWHNMIMPRLYEDTHTNHEGIFIMLIAYFVLASFMVFLYPFLFKESKSVVRGLKLGIFVGVLWIFPYTLAMAGAHETSIVYVFKNTIWHMVEQGIGGGLIAFVHNPVQ